MSTYTGILDWPPRSEGRVRRLNGAWLVQSDQDPVLPTELGSKFNLRHGVELTVEVVDRSNGAPAGAPNHPGHAHRGRHGQPHHARAPHRDQRRAGPVVGQIIAIEGQDPAKFAQSKKFEDLTSIDPQPRLTLEYPGCPASCRLVDLFCPIGRGQRGLIVSPPKAGKTTLLKDLATALLRNHPDVFVFVLLVDERPEEVTDFRRSFADAAATPGAPATDAGAEAGTARCRVIGSSNDHDVEKHIAVSLLTIERAKRMVEAGRHVVVLMDSLTRLGRAFNRSRQYASSGRTMTGGIDSRALEVPKQIFGAARNTEEAGSLTIIASCLVDTGSQGDQVIFEEFKGTGNSEIVLSRQLANNRIFPAIDISTSGTRKEEKLFHPDECERIKVLRRVLSQLNPNDAMRLLIEKLEKTRSNAEFLLQFTVRDGA